MEKTSPISTLDEYLETHPEEALYIWIWITSLFWYEAWIICWITDSMWFSEILSWNHLKEIKKTKLKSAIEKLLCCWILEIVDWEIVFNRDRYIEMNNLWMKVDWEKHSKYRWLWTYDDMIKYSDMKKFVNKMFK